jgi:phage gpG-like protein
MEIRAEVLGEEILHRRLVGIGDRAENMEPALREVGRFWMDTERELFDSSGASAGRPWPATHAGNKPLIDTSRLMESLTVEDHEDQIFDAGDSWLVFGTAREGARFHYTGTKYLDKRRPIDIGPRERRQTVKILQRFCVTGEIGRAW